MVLCCRRRHRGFVARLGRHYSWNNRGRGDLTRRSFGKIDPVMLQRRGKRLVEAGAVFRVGGVRADQVVLCNGEGALLLQNIGGG